MLQYMTIGPETTISDWFLTNSCIYYQECGNKIYNGHCLAIILPYEWLDKYIGSAADEIKGWKFLY